MTFIISPQNQYVKLFRALANAKGRREHGLFPVEGEHLIAEMLAAGWKPRLGYVAPELCRAEALAERLRLAADLYLEVSASVFARMSHTVSPQGIAAAAPLPHYTLASLPSGPGVFLAVHELRDPGNMGTMIRTAYAAGSLALLAIGDCADFFAPKVVRAAAGALFYLPVLELTREQFLAWAEQSNIALIAAVARGGRPLPEAAFPTRCAILIGSETRGLPPALLTACQANVTIPMPGGAESLNAAVAAGIVLYEYNRQQGRQAFPRD